MPKLKPLVRLPDLTPEEYEFLQMCLELQASVHLDTVKECPQEWADAEPIFREAGRVNALLAKVGSSVQYNQDGSFAEPLPKE